MKTTQKLLSLFSLLITCYGHSQYNVQPGYSEKLRSGTTYVPMNRPDAPDSKVLADVLKKYWTFSKLEFISPEDVQKHMSAGSFFLTFGSYEERSTDFSSPTNFAGIEASKSRVYLELWTPQESYLEGSKKKFTKDDRYQVARVELAVNFSTRSKPGMLNYIDQPVSSAAFNWGAGYLKNYIQQLGSALTSKNGLYYDAKKADTETLKKLAGKKILVPDYTLYDYKVTRGVAKYTVEDSQQDAAELFGDYKGAYEVVPSVSLNDKILSEPSGFYYLSSVTSGTDKFVSVVNSETGALVYLMYVPVAKGLKQKDVKTLAKKME